MFRRLFVVGFDLQDATLVMWNVQLRAGDPSQEIRSKASAGAGDPRSLV